MSNLIEQLGGYEAAKERLKKENLLSEGDYEYGQRKLLEYRRANNIFEVGDRVSVALDDPHLKGDFTVLSVFDEVVTLNSGEKFESHLIRHRLPQLEVLNDFDIPPNTIILGDK